jgi:hypothetical protein
MEFPQEIKGHVDSLSRAINVPNAQANATGVAEVNPVFTWVRLAQRVPVRVHLDVVPEDVRLVQGMTATVQMHRIARQRSLSLDDRPGGRERMSAVHSNGFPAIARIGRSRHLSAEKLWPPSHVPVGNCGSRVLSGMSSVRALPGSPNAMI